MNRDRSNADDTRDARTGQGPLPHGDRNRPPVNSSDVSDYEPLHLPDDPVNAANVRASPSSYTMEEIEEGETPLDEGMDRMIDPSIGRERLSTNPDVLDLDRSFLIEGEEPDFSGDPGTTDVIEAIEGEETYFAPVDPPMRTERSGFESVDVLGGFAGSALEEPLEPEDHPLRLQLSDDELVEQVRYALQADAYTTDLNIEVEVEDGVVYLHGKVRSLEDIEQAEQVAGSVPRVVSVEEDLEIV